MYLFTNIFANAIQHLTKPNVLVSGLGTTIPKNVLKGLHMYLSSLILTIFLMIMYHWKNMLERSIMKRTTLLNVIILQLQFVV